MNKQRKDKAMAATVERGIMLKDTVSMHQAAIFLASGGVPMEVAVRVLTTPYRRMMQESDDATAPQPTDALAPQQVPAQVPAPDASPDATPMARHGPEPGARTAPERRQSAQPDWRDIIYSSGATFGVPVDPGKRKSE